MPKVDWLILTAANAAQARGYEAQLQERRRQGSLADFANFRVIADPHGRRVGSGGSTIWVLHELAKSILRTWPRDRAKPSRLTDVFRHRRIIVIHSGGDSRRLVAYAAQGKAFTPLPCKTRDGAPATLFDLIAHGLLGLPAPAEGQVLLASGDVLLTFDHAAVDFSSPGVTGVAYPGPIERGSKHGVYIAGRDGVVTDFLQKPDAATATARGAMDAVGRVLIDTGLISLDPDSAQRWLTASGVGLRRGRLRIDDGLLSDLLHGQSPAIDLYEHLTKAMPKRLRRDAYLQAIAKPSRDAAADERHRRRMTQLHTALNGQPFRVNVLPWCEFFHIGTSRELLANINTLGRTAQSCGFANFEQSIVADRAAMEGAFVYNSILRHESTRTGAGVLIEACHIEQATELPGRNIVSGWPAPPLTPPGTVLRLPEGWGLVCLPIGNGHADKWTVVLFGVDDDFKTAHDRGGTFGNTPITEFLARHHLLPADLWSAGAADASLWNAALWPIGSIKDSLRLTMWMCDGRRQPRAIDAWRRSQRLSMAQVLLRVDHQRLLAHREEIRRVVGVHNLGVRLLAEPPSPPPPPAASLAEELRSPDEARLALRQIAQAAGKQTSPLPRARLWRAAWHVVDRFSSVTADAVRLCGAPPDQAAIAEVALAVEQSIPVPDRPRPAAILHDQAVWVTTPVRLDLSGGWTDTPPICTEMGGAVVNAAVRLNGQYPVQVMAKLREEPVITLHSIDLGQSLRITDARQALSFRDVQDWAALPKAALVLAGVCPRKPAGSLRRWLDALGGGLDITLFSALPKGSGLGTSSVLGAAVLACLARVTGEPITSETLIARTSLLEQLMTTAGGWQDQIGGITPGIKLIQTAPGAAQTPSLHWTATGMFRRDSDLRPRILLYYTGQRRLARNILRNVVNRYLSRDPDAMPVFDELKASALRMKESLDAQDFDAVARGIDHYWSLKKSLDPGSTNAVIESLLNSLRGDLIGRLLPGAGGGGFIFMIARSDAAAQRIQRRLLANPPNPHARFFDLDVDHQGLRVTVL